MTIKLANGEKFIIPKRVQDRSNGNNTLFPSIGKFIISETETLIYREERYGGYAKVNRKGQKEFYGHEYTSVSILEVESVPGWKYRPGKILFQVTWVSCCQGPGYSCAYSHLPVIEVGEYQELEPGPQG